MAIQGVIFPNQKVSAADHAALFELFISDGLISGCGASPLRNTLTITSGLFVLKGRLIKIVGSEQITIPDSIVPSSGTKTIRLVGTIDLNQVSTASEFHQFSFRLGETSETLTKDDINTGTGKVYEIEWALLTIDAQGNISHLDVKIPNAIASGGEGGGGGNTVAFTYMVNGVDQANNPSYVVYIDEGSNNWRYKFLKSGTLTFTRFNRSLSGLDLFLVGGGGGATTIAGGGGGYTTTVRRVVPTVGTSYEVRIGDGGAYNSGYNGVGGDGGSTTAFGSTANGGQGAQWREGGDGGSGGGGWTNTTGNSGAGGSNGSDGGDSNKFNAGDGQGTTTKEFGESAGTLYAGGGAGTANSGNDYVKQLGGEGGGGDSGYGSGNPTNGESGTANTGGGGGALGGSGGSGIVVIRNSRAA